MILKVKKLTKITEIAANRIVLLCLCLRMIFFNCKETKQWFEPPPKKKNFDNFHEELLPQQTYFFNPTSFET